MAFEDMSDIALVNYIGGAHPPQAQNAGLAEIQRRQMEAIRDFNRAAGRQANVMIVLTVVIVLLTIVLVWKELAHG